MKYIIERNNNYLMHRSHKYIDKHKSKSGNWIYVYDKSKASRNRNIIKKDKTYNNDVPDEYQPKMKKTDYAGRQGYVNEYGIFFDGDYETARAKMYEWDLKIADAKMKQQKEEQSYKGRAKRKINNFLRSTFSEDTAEKTRNAVENVINNAKDKELKKLNEQYSDMLNLSKNDYDRLSDEDKRKWEKAEDKYEAKRKQIIEKYSKK